MPTSISKKIDRNRYYKTYPFIQRNPRYAYLSDTNIKQEIGEICFNGADSVSITFAGSYLTVPNVIATPINDDVNIWLESVSLTGATIKSSYATYACVSYQIMEIV